MIYTLENEQLRVQVNSLGAELWEVYSKQHNKHLLWQGDPSYWPHRSPTLFPICGKLLDGKVVIDNQSYYIPPHGFVRDYEHNLVSQTATELVLIFGPTDETQGLYPFAFDFSTTFILEGATLSHRYDIANRSKNMLSFSVGYHSGFFAGKDVKLFFSQAETADRLVMGGDGLICTEQKDFLHEQQELPVTANVFPGTVLLRGVRSNWVDIISSDRPALRIGFSGFPYLMLWSNHVPAPFICVEPWHGLPDYKTSTGKLEDKSGIRTLEAMQSFNCTQTITLL